MVAAPFKFSAMSDVVPIMKTLFAWQQLYSSSKIRISNSNLDLSRKSRYLVWKMFQCTVLKYIGWLDGGCAVEIFCDVWCCSAHEDIICMATALFYGFDETTTVNLGHKITLYSQPTKILIEEMSDNCLIDSLYDCLHWDKPAKAEPTKACKGRACPLSPRIPQRPQESPGMNFTGTYIVIFLG